MSILKTTLMEELGLNNSDYSVLISAFMIPYTLMYFFVGGMVDRFGSHYVLTVLMVLMSLPTLISGLSSSMSGPIAGRVLLGLAVCWISDRLVARGMEQTRARLAIIWSVTSLAPLVFLLPSLSNAYATVAIMTVINFMCTAWLSMATIMMGGLAPRIAIATAIGVMSALGGVTSIIFNGFVALLSIISAIPCRSISVPRCILLKRWFLPPSFLRRPTFTARQETV